MLGRVKNINIVVVVIIITTSLKLLIKTVLLLVGSRLHCHVDPILILHSLRMTHQLHHNLVELLSANHRLYGSKRIVVNPEFFTN